MSHVHLLNDGNGPLLQDMIEAGIVGEDDPSDEEDDVSCDAKGRKKVSHEEAQKRRASNAFFFCNCFKSPDEDSGPWTGKLGIASAIGQFLHELAECWQAQISGQS